jgi:polyhydroxyalkanoate synthesis regulator phasin
MQIQKKRKPVKDELRRKPQGKTLEERIEALEREIAKLKGEV